MRCSLTANQIFRVGSYINANFQRLSGNMTFVEMAIEISKEMGFNVTERFVRHYAKTIDLKSKIQKRSVPASTIVPEPEVQSTDSVAQLAALVADNHMVILQKLESLERDLAKVTKEVANLVLAFK